LPGFGYNEKQIALIADIILATSMQKPPQTHLEKIMCDADLDHLGRKDFHVLSGLLKKELNAYGVDYTERQWDELQIRFLEKHTYYTASALKKNQANKEYYLNEIKNRM
jgi:uncharacterized protein